MVFSSLPFLFFYLPATLAVYRLTPLKLRNLCLLAVSLLFYGWGEPVYITIMLLSIAVDYTHGILVERWRDNDRRARMAVASSVFFNLAILVFFKYWDFLAESVNGLTGLGLPVLGLPLPIGISFYTFQTMSYTIDVYRGDFPAEKDVVSFALYVTYFPQLVAGPIESPGSLLPQLKAEHRLCWDDFTAGVRLLLCGFFRKCVVADFCGIFVNAVFSAAEAAGSLAIFCAGALFCIQMYCDFAGYSEIAAGAARLMGVRLMRNFDRPYLSQSYTEFFRRWHISLNRWFTSYVYIPLGGGRRGKGRKILSILVVFTLCGLWHGARWTYVLWGLYAAFWLCVESLLDVKKRFGPRWDCPLGRLARRSVMFLIFVPAALLFRAESVGQLGVIFRRLFTAWGFGGAYLQETLDQLGLSVPSLVQLVLCIVAMAKLYAWGQYDLPAAKTDSQSAARLSSCVYLAAVSALCWLALLQTQDAAIFAYFQF